LTLNTILQTSNARDPYFDIGTNVFDDSVQLNGPANAPLNVGAEVDFHGPIVAPGGLNMIGLNLTGAGFFNRPTNATLVLRSDSDSIGGPIELNGTLSAVDPASLSSAPIQLGTPNFVSFMSTSGALRLYSDLRDANFANNLTVNFDSSLQIAPTSFLSSGEPNTLLGDSTRNQFVLGNLNINSSNFSISASQTQDVVLFQSLSLSGSTTISLDQSSYLGPKSVARVAGMSSSPATAGPPPPYIFLSPPPPPPGPYSLTLIGGEMDVTAGSPGFSANIIVQNGLLVAAADGALGTGGIQVDTGGAIDFSQTQTSFPSVSVSALGAIGGDLTGALYGQNVTLADGAILFHSAGPLPSRGASGAVYWQGITSLTGNYSAGDDGSTSIYRGLAFGPFTPDGGFVGTINEAVPGQGIQIVSTSYTAIGNVAGGNATFIGTGGVTITATPSNPNTTNSEVDFLTAPAGSQTVFNVATTYTGRFDPLHPDFAIRGSNVIPAGDTLNVVNGDFQTFTQDAVAQGGKVNIEAGATLIHQSVGSATTGTYEILPNGCMIVADQNDTPSHGANYIFDAGSVVQFNPGASDLNQAVFEPVDMGDPTWLSPNSDLDMAGVVNFEGAGVELGAGRRIVSTEFFGGIDTGAGISGAPGAPATASFIFSATSGRELIINANIAFGSQQTLQIGDAVPWAFNDQSQDGTVYINSPQATVGNLNVVAGTLQFGYGGQPALPFNVTGTMTIGANATVSGAANIQAAKIIIAGTIAPGYSPGTLSLTGDTTILGGASYQWQINSTLGTAGSDPGWDLFTVNGKITLDSTAAADPITVPLQSLDNTDFPNLLADFDPTQNYSFPFIQATGILNFQPSDFSLDLTQFQNTYDGTWSIQQNGVGELDIVYTAVPEPLSVAWIAGGAALLLRRRGKRL
jgi:hypothetical protein